MKKEKTNKKEYFISPTRGKLSFDSVIYDLVDFMQSDPEEKYSLIVGTDSKLYFDKALFVSVILIHKVGHGARYFYKKQKNSMGRALRPRIYHETILSLELSQKLIEKIKDALTSANLDYDFAIHVDIGRGGPTKDMIKEIVGMIQGNGFVVKYKPESFGASVVADKHT